MPPRAAHSRQTTHPIPARAPLTLAIVTCLGLASLQTAAASESAHADMQKVITQAFDTPAKGSKTADASLGPRASLPSSLSTASKNLLLAQGTRTKPSALPTASAYAQDPGTVGNPESWQTEEFNADWGLDAMGAQYAYARGLSGNGVKLGVLDTGTLLTHPEFAGSGRMHPVKVTITDPDDGSSATTDGGVARLVFGDHGTHVAGTIAGSRDGNGMHGVSFGSDLYVGTGYAMASVDDLDLGSMLDYINMFIAQQSSPENQDDLVEQLTVDDIAALLPGQWSAPPFESRFVAGNFDQMAAQGVRVISNSWGDTPELGATFKDIKKSYDDSVKIDDPNTVPPAVLTYDAMRRAVNDHDVLFVFAAGNESGTGDDAGTVTHAGLNPTLPAFIQELESNWVSVVALDGDWKRSDFSNICGETKNWCISAPGRNITSAGFDPYEPHSGDRLNAVAFTLAQAKYAGTAGESVQEILENYRVGLVADPAQLDTWKPYYAQFGIDITQANTFNTVLSIMVGTEYDPLYVDKDGTSMATPHVSGALGLLIERYPYLTATQVRNVMFTTATDLGAAGVDEVYGWGLVNLEKAIDGPGQLLGDTVVNMTLAAGGTKVWEGAAWDDWTNDISGPGRLYKDGAGWLRLSGDNTFAGASVRVGTLELDGNNALTSDVQVTGGVFILNGNLQGSDLQVYENGNAIIEGSVSSGGTWVGGWLGGNGRLGSTKVDGTIAPGDAFVPAIGTLSFTGNYTQALGSFYAVDVSAAGASDRINVDGTATLQGGSVVVTSQPGTYLPGLSYRILSATGGVAGTFEKLDTTAWDQPFLALTLVYSPLAVNLDVTRGVSFASVGDTWNQVSTGIALDELSNASPLLQSMTQLNTAQALGAFDQLSGELYPSLRSVLVESSRMPREAVMQRARVGADGFAAQSDDDRHNGLWANVYRSGGHVAADGNAQRAEHSSHAVLAGYDYRFDAGWQLGGMLGSGRTDFNLDERSNKGRADNRHAGLYGGGNWGGFGLRAGLIYAKHQIDTERHVAYPGFSDQTYARFDGSTRQAVIEAGYRFDRQSWELEPFLQYANVRVKQDEAQEGGGDAALYVSGSNSKINLGTAGVRFNANLKGTQQEATWLSLRGMLGYQRATGDRTPATNVAFTGGDFFNVRGAPIADGSVVAEAGIAARLSPNTLLELGYSGQFADEARDHGANAKLSVQF